MAMTVGGPMVRTTFSDHGRLAAGALVGAITAALFARGVIGGPIDSGAEPVARPPEPLPALPSVIESQPVLASSVPTTTTTTTTVITTTTTAKRTTTTTTTTVRPTTTTTTPRPTTTTTTRTCRLLC